jgi:peptide/nickel transport system substrate-binding protein
MAACRRPGKKLVGLAALALAWLAAISAAADAETMLRTRLNADIRSTDPGTNRDANTDGVMAHVVEGLVAFREDTSVGPMLAESWSVSNGGKTYTFHLRQGVRFHNGATMTAEDVVWSLKRWLDPATQWRCLSEFGANGIARVEAIAASDPLTVAVTLDQPTALFLPTLARPDCGQAAIIHRESIGPDGKWFAPVGTGPFKLGEWKRGNMSISSALTATSRAASRAVVIPAPRSHRSTACASTKALLAAAPILDFARSDAVRAFS